MINGNTKEVDTNEGFGRTSDDNEVVQFKSNGDVRSGGRGKRLTFFKRMMEHLELNQLNP